MTISPTQSQGICKLHLTAFRSYEQLLLQCDGRSVVLTGENGAGKTNLLEALSLLSPGKGFRNASGEHLLNRDKIETAWAVSALLVSERGQTQIGYGLDPDAHAKGRERKIVRIDQTNVRGQSDLSEYLQVLWLTPAMDRLLMDAPSERRKFLDRLVFGLDPEHAMRVKRYEHATKERLRLLKDGISTPAWLDALENTMIEYGKAIALARATTLERLSEHLMHAATKFPRAHLKMNGWVDDVLNESDFEQLYRQKLSENRAIDGIIGMTKAGPHRSDFVCYFDDEMTPASQCSTGEQKAMLLSIILAAARMQKHLKKGVPILLLDEVVAHLDPNRRKDLFDEIDALQLQTWMSGTDAHLFKEFGERAQHFYIENGIISAKTML